MRKGLIIIGFWAALANAFSVAAGDATPDISAKIQQALAKHIPGEAGGCAVGLWHQNKTLYVGGYGYANVEHQVPITPDTVFEIGSTSKQFTAAALLLLVEQGKLSPDDSVTQFVPEMPAYAKDISVRQLLNHSSGLRNYTAILELNGTGLTQPVSDESILRILARQSTTEFPPGEGFNYTNSGYFLARLIIERVSGQSLRDFARQHLFSKLAMRNTFFMDDIKEVVPHRALSYKRHDEQWKLNTSDQLVLGAAGVQTSVRDLSAWVAQWQSPNVLKPSLLKQMITPSQLNSGQPLPYGLGLWILGGGEAPTYEHNGFWGGYTSLFSYSHSSQMAYALLCNMDTIDVYALRGEFEHIVADEHYQIDLKSEPVETRIPAATAAFLPSGVYELQGLEKLVFFAQQQQPHFVSAQLGVTPLKSLSDFVFEVPGRGIRIEFTEQPGSETLNASWIWPDGNHTPLIKQPDVRFNEKDVASLTGTYINNELQARFDIVFEQGHLFAVHPTLDKVRLFALDKQVLLGDQRHLTSLRLPEQPGSKPSIRVTALDIPDLIFTRQE